MDERIEILYERKLELEDRIEELEKGLRKKDAEIAALKQIIKNSENVQSTDLISKAELFNKLAVIKAPPEANEYKGEVYSIIQAMETADDGWIPIEKRKPDTADHVMVTAKWDDLDYEVFELDYGVTKSLANRQGYIHQDYCKNLIEHIIAWQYKPEPYIEDGKNK